jgi:uncharacterized protein YggE
MAEVEPDRIRAIVGVSTVASTVGEALSAAAEAQERIIEAAVAAGVDRSAAQTVGYRVGQDYEPGGAVSRHRADVSLSLVFPDIAGASSLLAVMGEAAGDSFRVHGVNPEASDAEPARRVAREAAVTAAARQAGELASAAGVRLGRLKSLVEGAGGPGGQWSGGVRLMAASSGVPGIEGGGLTIRVEVTATYEIVQ